MLPIDDVLPDLSAALAAANCVVLVAPPGAGKTTRVPLALADEPFCAGRRIIVLEPRRMAARAAARHMAASLGEVAGETVGYRVRLESRVSARTRIELVTEGVFARMILDDPELAGVGLVIFDEFHERHLDGDLGLALALDVQGALRDDLKLMVMSATLDGAAVARHLGGAPVIESEGRSFAVETRHLPRDPEQRIEAAVAAAVRRAVTEETGSVLAFLPGRGEILRTAELLEGRLAADVAVMPLYGALPAEDQDRAIAPPAPGRRKVVLATAIAETSVTIAGVRIVIDCGYSRVPVFEPGTGLTRLETVRVSRASADQRRGRAGRTEPGLCYRLWAEGQTRALPPANRAEILDADLSRLVLDLAAWGVTERLALRFPDPPPERAWNEAAALLKALDALDAAGRTTVQGKALVGFALPPRFGHMLLGAADRGLGGLAAEIAVILTERGAGGRSGDLRDRIAALRRSRGGGGDAAQKLARRFAGLVGARSGGDDVEAAGGVLALAYPDRIAKSRDRDGSFLLASGRGCRIDPAERLAGEPFLAVAELQGGGAEARILLAAPIAKAEIDGEFAGHITTETVAEFDPTSGSVRARRRRRLGQIVLGEETIGKPDPETVAAALIAGIRGLGLAALPWTPALRQLRARVGFAAGIEGGDWPDMSESALRESLADWLGPYLAGKTALGQISADDLAAALRGRLPHRLLAALDTLAPSHFSAPTGSRIAIDYEAEGGPSLAVRVQELFGLDRHPTIGAGRVALVVHLLSPARRPVQVTRDLPGFWRGSYQAVKTEMRGRYPKHPWPDDPIGAAPTTRAKPRGK